jgi:hypothetical protein
LSVINEDFFAGQGTGRSRNRKLRRRTDAPGWRQSARQRRMTEKRPAIINILF